MPIAARTDRGLRVWLAFSTAVHHHRGAGRRRAPCGIVWASARVAASDGHARPRQSRRGLGRRAGSFPDGRWFPAPRAPSLLRQSVDDHVCTRRNP